MGYKYIESNKMLIVSSSTYINYYISSNFPCLSLAIKLNFVTVILLENIVRQVKFDFFPYITIKSMLEIKYSRTSVIRKRLTRSFASDEGKVPHHFIFENNNNCSF